MARHTTPIPSHPDARIQQRLADIEKELQALRVPLNTTAFLYKSTGQALAAAGNTRVELDAAIETPTALWETGKYVVPAAGMYLCLGQVTFSAVIVGATNFAVLSKNATETRRGQRQAAASTGIHYYTVGAFIQAAAGDRLELVASNQSASASSIEINGEIQNYLSVTKIK